MGSVRDGSPIKPSPACDNCQLKSYAPGLFGAVAVIRNSACCPGATGLARLTCWIPQLSPLGEGRLRATNEPGCQVCVPVFNHLSTAVNCCPCCTEAGPTWLSESELYSVDLGNTVMVNWREIVAPAESPTSS